MLNSNQTVLFSNNNNNNNKSNITSYVYLITTIIIRQLNIIVQINSGESECTGHHIC